MAGRPSAGATCFLAVFILVSAASGAYYHGRLTKLDSGKKGWTCRCDFRVFWTAGFRLNNFVFGITPPAVSAGGAVFAEELDEYLDGERSLVYNGKDPFYHYRYAPVTAFLMSPFALISSPANALVAWYLVSALSLLASLLVLGRRSAADLSLPEGGRLIIMWALFFVSLRFYLMCLAVGQSDTIVALLLSLAAVSYVRARDIAAGLLLAAAIQFKPFFAPAAVYLLIAGRRRAAVSAGAGCLAFLAAPVLLAGPAKAEFLTRGWLEMLGMSVPSQLLNVKNQSITYFLAKMILESGPNGQSIKPDLLFGVIWFVFTALSYGALLAFRRFGRDAASETRFRYLEFSVMVIATLLFSPLVWTAHFIYLIVPAAAAAAFTLKSRRRAALYAAFAAFAALSLVAGTDITKFIPGFNDARFINVSCGTLFLAYALVASYRSPEGR